MRTPNAKAHDSLNTSGITSPQVGQCLCGGTVVGSFITKNYIILPGDLGRDEDDCRTVRSAVYTNVLTRLSYGGNWVMTV
jgi:hypothetical protein